jgi:hypothetical protein
VEGSRFRFEPRSSQERVLAVAEDREQSMLLVAVQEPKNMGQTELRWHSSADGSRLSKFRSLMVQGEVRDLEFSKLRGVPGVWIAGRFTRISDRSAQNLAFVPFENFK